MAQIKRIGWKFFKVKKTSDTFVGCFKCDSADIDSKINYCSNCNESYLKRIPNSLVLQAVLSGIITPSLTVNMLTMSTNYSTPAELAFKIAIFSAPIFSTLWLLRISDKYDNI